MVVTPRMGAVAPAACAAVPSSSPAAAKLYFSRSPSATKFLVSPGVCMMLSLGWMDRWGLPRLDGFDSLADGNRMTFRGLGLLKLNGSACQGMRVVHVDFRRVVALGLRHLAEFEDRKSTRLNSSHVAISY